jgi:hypothetical protein
MRDFKRSHKSNDDAYFHSFHLSSYCQARSSLTKLLQSSDKTRPQCMETALEIHHQDLCGCVATGNLVLLHRDLQMISAYSCATPWSHLNCCVLGNPTHAPEHQSTTVVGILQLERPCFQQEIVFWWIMIKISLFDLELNALMLIEP